MCAQAGSATLWAVIAMGLLLLLAQVGVLVTLLIARQHQADAAADLAALSGAAGLQRGASPCAAAARVAELNGVAVVRCEVMGADVRVTVRATLDLPLDLSVDLTGAARAGP